MSIDSTVDAYRIASGEGGRLKLSKRVFDLIFSSSILLCGLPIFFSLALIVKLSSPGPVFFGSRRMGLGGATFFCWKFRTMCIDAEKKLGQLLMSDSTLLSEWETYYKLKSDPRITWIGKWLRKTSLDELPQFWNVLKGDMSIVGPRPLPAEMYQLLGSKAPKILSVRPGLTSIWAVRGRNQLTLTERTRLEVFYIDHQSFLLDCRLILQTALAMIHQRGAY